MELVSRVAFFLVSVILMLLAAGLAGYAIYSVVATFRTAGADTAILDVIGYLIIATAVFNVAKYLHIDGRNGTDCKHDMHDYILYARM